MTWTKTKIAMSLGILLLFAAGISIPIVGKITSPYNSRDFWVTQLPANSQPRQMFHGQNVRAIGPTTTTFPASPVRLCSINGLLNQCTEVGGCRYFVDKDISNGMVQFGNEKPLDGAEWVAAFENALQTGQPEWFDSITKAPRRENLVLIRFAKKKIVLVVPQDKAAQYR